MSSHLRISSDTRLLEIPGVLTADDIEGIDRFNGLEDLRTFLLQGSGTAIPGRFHGEQRHKLEKMILHHVARGSELLDELGFSDDLAARPLQAALASAGSFILGASVPLLVILLVPQGVRDLVVVVASLATLAALGWVGARVGGGSAARAAVRVVVGGGIAMAVTIGIGRLLGASGL